MLLITNFVELRVVTRRSRTRAGHPHAVSGRPMPIHTCHAMPMLRCAVTLRSRFLNGMVVTWHGRGMACVNQTRPHCVNQMGKTRSKPLATRHGGGIGTAWHVWISPKWQQSIVYKNVSTEKCKRAYDMSLDLIKMPCFNYQPVFAVKKQLHKGQYEFLTAV
jgi:hypothetical protein